MIDLRSDTVTRPCPAMYEAMQAAPLGDDVLGDDPTVIQLQQRACEMFGVEKALFCPSGTMTNQISLAMNSAPLQQVICEYNSHVYQYEVGGMAFHSRCSARTLNGERGMLTAEMVEAAINPEDVHQPETSCVSLENTTNRGGGDIYDFVEIQKIKDLCQDRGLRLHMDGARLFNALVETPESAKDYGKTFDTISICLSKGLGAPVGSLLLCSQKESLKAEKLRKVMGGGMRQSGILAAAGLYALEHNIERLKEDHQRAKQIESTLKELPYVDSVLPVKTNIVIFNLKKGEGVDRFVSNLGEKNIHCYGFGGQAVRFVTHKDFTEEMLNPLTEALRFYS